jgi:hypothetical protein
LRTWAFVQVRYAGSFREFREKTTGFVMRTREGRELSLRRP